MTAEAILAGEPGKPPEEPGTPSKIPGGRATAASSGALRRPAALFSPMDVSGLIDADGGFVDRAIYSDPALYQQELRRVFAPSWLYLAHTSQLSQPGDFVTAYMGEDPIIVTLDENGQVRAFLNACRHRGTRVCRADLGQTRTFTCAYHGWSYDLTGRLVSAPKRETYPASFSLENWGLVEVPHVSAYKGLIFGTWNPEPLSLREALGDMAWYMDAMLDHDDEGTEVVGGVHKWIIDSNWKIPAEGFASDWYHLDMTHSSVFMLMNRSGQGSRTPVGNRSGRQYLSEAGHGANFTVHPKNRFEAKPVHQHVDYEALRARLGDARVEGPLTYGAGTVFPNFSYLPANGAIRVWHPKGPDRMEVWSWTIVDRSWPDDVKEAQHLQSLRTFGPTGIFEQDDPENWNDMQAIGRGFVTSTLPLNYQMGLGSETHDGRHPGLTAELYSDAGALSFYAHWGRLMNTPAWHENESSAEGCGSEANESP